MRLGKEAYLAVQPIYYPGFTWAGGLGEAAGMVAVLVLLLLTPIGSADFWWVGRRSSPWSPCTPPIGC